jgi:hypothetical protein
MWIQDRDHAEEPIDSRDRGVLCGARPSRGGASWRRIAGACNNAERIAVQSFNCLVSAFEIHVSGRHEKHVELCFFFCDLNARSVDILRSEMSVWRNVGWADGLMLFMVAVAVAMAVAVAAADWMRPIR